MSIPRRHVNRRLTYSRPRSTPDQPPQLFPTSNEPGANRLTNFVNRSPQRHQGRRSGTSLNEPEAQSRPHPFTQLTSDYAAFCGFGYNAFANCVSFCHKRPGLWDEKQWGLLPQVARQLLARGEQGDNETARRVVSRYLMLRGSSNAKATHRGRLEWLAELNHDGDRRTNFLDTYTKYVSALEAEIAAPNPRHSSATERQSIRWDDSVPNPGATAMAVRGGRRFSQASTGTTPSVARGSPREHRGYAAAQPSLASGATDADLDSMAGGPAPQGQSGPKTVITQNWPRNVRDRLHAEYRLHEGDATIDVVFGVGSVISVMWHENFGNSLSSKLAGVPKTPNPAKLNRGCVTEGPKGEYIYSHIRRFVVVIQRRGHSVSVPITSYGSKGLANKKLSVAERKAHAIVHDAEKKPMSVPGEGAFAKLPIAVNILAPNETLSQSSRIYYAKPYSIDHNIKVKHIGQVVEGDIDKVTTAFQLELFPDSLVESRSSRGGR